MFIILEISLVFLTILCLENDVNCNRMVVNIISLSQYLIVNERSEVSVSVVKCSLMNCGEV